MGSESTIETEYIHDQDRELELCEITSYPMKKWLLHHIEKVRHECGRSLEDFHILDYGCGRGQAVGWLRLHGYQAWGLEVHRKWIEFARPRFKEAGLDADDLLRLCPEGGVAPFPDGEFHFVYSLSVMEHVSDLKPVIEDIERLTATGGGGFHQFIASHSPVEGHLRMPLVHWLPKSEMRHRAIELCLLLGIDPKWQVCGSKTFQEKANFYYRFSVDQTFYRAFHAYLAAFEQAGLHAKLGILGHSKLSGSWLNPLFSAPYLSRLLEWGVARFWTVIINTTKMVPEAGETTASIF